jgi:hypothetical protein
MMVNCGIFATVFHYHMPAFLPWSSTVHLSGLRVSVSLTSTSVCIIMFKTALNIFIWILPTRSEFIVVLFSTASTYSQSLRDVELYGDRDDMAVVLWFLCHRPLVYHQSVPQCSTERILVWKFLVSYRYRSSRSHFLRVIFHQSPSLLLPHADFLLSRIFSNLEMSSSITLDMICQHSFDHFVAGHWYIILFSLVRWLYSSYDGLYVGSTIVFSSTVL